ERMSMPSDYTEAVRLAERNSAVSCLDDAAVEPAEGGTSLDVRVGLHRDEHGAIQFAAAVLAGDFALGMHRRTLLVGRRAAAQKNIRIARRQLSGDPYEGPRFWRQLKQARKIRAVIQQRGGVDLGIDGQHETVRPFLGVNFRKELGQGRAAPEIGKFLFPRRERQLRLPTR